MKITHINHGEWTEKRFEPDKPSAGNGKANGLLDRWLGRGRSPQPVK
jgi:hypothetical protein